MKTHKHIFSFETILSFISLAFVFLCFGFSVHAQSVLPLQVAPARQEIKLDPGEQGAFNVKFFNLTDSPMSGIVKVADFVVDDKEGTPRIIDDISQASPRFAASHWITLPYDRVTIPAQDVLTLQARFTVPSDARPGGRYVAIYFEPIVNLGQPIQTNDKEASLGVSSRIASLAYIQVKGPITEQALALRFTAPSFLEYGPVTVMTEILNKGDYHIQPRGVITMTNMFNGVVDQSKLETVNIFPDASREFENKLGSKWLFGRYKISLSASYGEGGKAILASTYIFFFPWKVALIVLLSLILIIVIARHFYNNALGRQSVLNKKVQEEESEIQKLKQQLNKRND